MPFELLSKGVFAGCPDQGLTQPLCSVLIGAINPQETKLNLFVTPILEEVQLFLCNTHVCDFHCLFSLLLFDWVPLEQDVCLCGTVGNSRLAVCDASRLWPQLCSCLFSHDEVCCLRNHAISLEYLKSMREHCSLLHRSLSLHSPTFCVDYSSGILIVCQGHREKKEVVRVDGKVFGRKTPSFLSLIICSSYCKALSWLPHAPTHSLLR